MAKEKTLIFKKIFSSPLPYSCETGLGLRQSIKWSVKIVYIGYSYLLLTLVGNATSVIFLLIYFLF